MGDRSGFGVGSLPGTLRVSASEHYVRVRIVRAAGAIFALVARQDVQQDEDSVRLWAEQDLRACDQYQPVVCLPHGGQFGLAEQAGYGACAGALRLLQE